MHNNYYFLRRLSDRLRSELKDFVVKEVFSQAKNELIIRMTGSGPEKIIRANFDPSFCILSFPEEFKRARRNSIDLFDPLIGKKVSDVVQISNDRSFYMGLSGDIRLLFKMHGNKANILLIRGQGVIEMFRKGLKQDMEVKIETLEKKIDFNREIFDKAHGNIANIFPTWGKAFEWYLRQHHYEQMSMDERYNFVVSTLEYLEDPAFYLHTVSGKRPVLSLFKMSDEDIVFSDPLEALNKLFAAYFFKYQLAKKKEGLINNLLRSIRKAESYIRKSYDKLEQLEKGADYKLLADLIMANLHKIKPHEPEVILMDFYTQKPIAVKLNPNLSPQANASRYYKKAKNQNIEIENITKHIFAREAQINSWREEIEALKKVTSFKQLKMLAKEPVAIKEKEDVPYHRYEYMDYEILVGKNAAKNELLTFRTAGKEDLFLHVKDAPGSHVTVRRKAGQNFPSAVIEMAASLAAKYSKRSGESLVPVLYTLRKYVRKARGAPKGAVIVEKEKVLIVKPEHLKK